MVVAAETIPLGLLHETVSTLDQGFFTPADTLFRVKGYVPCLCGQALVSPPWVPLIEHVVVARLLR